MLIDFCLSLFYDISDKLVFLLGFVSNYFGHCGTLCKCKNKGGVPYIPLYFKLLIGVGIGLASGSLAECFIPFGLNRDEDKIQIPKAKSKKPNIQSKILLCFIDRIANN